MKKVLKTSKSDPITRLEHWNPLIRKAYKSRFLVCFQQLEKGNGKLLELGIGSGYTIPHLSHQGFKVYGIDLHGKLPDIKNGYQAVHIRRGNDALPSGIISDQSKMPINLCTNGTRIIVEETINKRLYRCFISHFEQRHPNQHDPGI